MRASWARHLYFTLQAIRREPVALALDDVHRTARLSRDALFAQQAARQREQLLFALEQVPYYRRTLSPFAADIRAASTWERVHAVMERIPLLERGTVTRERDAMRAPSIPRSSTYPDSTSGSSGTPLRFDCDRGAWAYRHALMFRCMADFGVFVGEPSALFFGLHWSARSRLMVAARDAVFNRTRVSAYDIAPERVRAHVAALRRRRPTHAIGYPSAVFDFCVLVRDRGESLRDLALKAVFLTAEPLRAYQRELITDVTGARCVDTYGSAEGGLTACECPAGSLHVNLEATWLQLRGGDATRGEAIVTDMMLRAFPMIRYAIGDDVVLGSGTCACGRAHPTVATVEGRSGDAIVLPNGKRINANLPSYILKPFAALGAIRQYRFVQEEDGVIELRLVPSRALGDDVLESLARECAAAFGEDCPVRVRVVESLPVLANAKHRDFVPHPRWRAMMDAVGGARA